jgi:hypothetical protein
MVSKRVRGEEKRRRRRGLLLPGRTERWGSERSQRRKRFTSVRKPRAGKASQLAVFLEAKIGFKIAILLESERDFNHEFLSWLTLFYT